VRAPSSRRAAAGPGAAATARPGALPGRRLDAAAAAKAGGITAAAAVSLALPLWLSAANLTVYVLTGLYAVTAIGLSLLMGYAGQVSLGQAVFFAIGAYTAAVLSLHGTPAAAALVAAPVLAAAVAAAVGVPILRLRGHHLAFATLAFQLIVLSVISNTAFLGGGLGFTAIPALGIGGAALTSPRGYAWLVWAVTAAVVVLTLNIIRSRPGRALRALATSEAAAESAGVPVVRYKLVTFALSAAYAGFAGGIYVFFIGYASPGSFPVSLSVELVVMVVIFGLGSVWGALLGAVGISVLVQVLTNVGTLPGMPQYMPTLLSYAAYGVILVLIMVFLPGGLLPALRGRYEAAARRLGIANPAGPGRGAAPPPAAALARALVSSLRSSAARGGGKPPPEQTRRQ
jgi:branched-chain amino acid transport system permease protein